MRLKEIQERLDLKVSSGGDLEREVTGGYASDLLSDVLAHAEEGDLWVTLQTHQNIVAIASAKGLSGVVLVNDRTPEKETLEKAASENIPIFTTDLPTFEIVGRLYQLGITGR